MALGLTQPLRRRHRAVDEPANGVATREEPAAAPATGDGPAASRPAPRRVLAPSRGRMAAAGMAAGVGALLLTIARLIRLLAGVVALLIAAAIVLRLLSANPGNAVVRDVHDVGRALAGPFKNLFLIKNPKTSILVNWGIAAIVYLVVGGLLASLLARLGLRARARRPVAA
jgi:hypothetical protein